MNAQQKVVGIIFIILIIAVVMFLLWYNSVITFTSASQPIPISNVYVTDNDQFSNVQPELTEDEIIIDSPNQCQTNFKPYNSSKNYKFLNLSDSDNLSYTTTANSTSHPNPSMSLYNVKTQSYITGLGDPIRGDLYIEPRQGEMYKTKYTKQDARIGALTSIG